MTRSWTGRVFIGVSLDGYIARPDGDIAWLTDPPNSRDHASISSAAPALEWDTFFPTVDQVVMGRGTYEKVQTFGFWPYEGKRVIVLSTTLDAEAPRVTVVRTLDETLTELNDAQQVYVDGGRVVQTFLRADLIDEITVSWAPVLLGEGLPLFGHLDTDVLLELRATHAHDNGMVSATYHVSRG